MGVQEIQFISEDDHLNWLMISKRGGQRLQQKKHEVREDLYFKCMHDISVEQGRINVLEASASSGVPEILRQCMIVCQPDCHPLDVEACKTILECKEKSREIFKLGLLRKCWPFYSRC